MEFKDIFSKNVMNKELHYIARQSTLTNNIDIHTNDHKIIFSSYEYFKMSVIITIYNCLSDFNLKYSEDNTIMRDYKIIKNNVNFDKLTPFIITEDYIRIQEISYSLLDLERTNEKIKNNFEHTQLLID